MDSYKNILTRIRQPLARVLTHGAQGYLFGSMVGLLTCPRLRRVHESGVRFAKVGMVYAGTEALLEPFGKGVWTKVASGAVAGAAVNGVGGGVGFGLYSGMVEFYDKQL